MQAIKRNIEPYIPRRVTEDAAVAWTSTYKEFLRKTERSTQIHGKDKNPGSKSERTKLYLKSSLSGGNSGLV